MYICITGYCLLYTFEHTLIYLGTCTLISIMAVFFFLIKSSIPDPKCTGWVFVEVCSQRFVFNAKKKDNHYCK